MKSYGGNSLAYTQDVIFMGGGAGGSQYDNWFDPELYKRVDGGGIVIIKAQSIDANGLTIRANGGDGDTTVDEGAPGGGGGGAVYLLCKDYKTPLNIEAKGGDGGDNFNDIFSGWAHGTGGGGGGGAIGFSTASVPANITTNVSGGTPGTVLNPLSQIYLSHWGAVDGQSGGFIFNLIDGELGLKDIIVCDTANFAAAVSIEDKLLLQSVQWSNGATGFSTSITTPGAYYATATTVFGCPVYDTAYIIPDTSLSQKLLVGDSIYCKNISSQVTLRTPGTYYSYLWNTGAVTPSIVVSADGQYTLTVSDSLCEVSDTINITFDKLPSIDLGPDLVACKGELLNIGDPQPWYTYQWNTGHIGCCIPVSAPGVYTLSATNRCGTYSDSIAISYFNCDSCLFVPTAFSPNGDGRNDRFRPIATCPVLDYRLMIFNRWGQQVFSSFNLESTWDGNYHNEQAELGVYFYQLEYRPGIGSARLITLRGDLTLIR